MIRKYENIEYLRAFSAIGIVLMHVLINGNYEISGFLFRKIIPSFTDLVFLFMVISGFSMCCGYYHRIIKNEIELDDFYKKRFKKIWPFFAFLCFVDFIISPSINSLCELIADLTLCFGFLPNPNLSVIGVGWFLGLIFVFYIIFPFFCFLLKNRKRAWVSFMISVVFNLLCIYYFDVERTNIIYSSMYFIAGGLLFLYKEEIVKIFESRKWLVIILLLISIIAYYNFNIYSVCALLISIVLLSICIIFPEGGNKFISFISGISFEIYLSHMVMFRLLEKFNFLRVTTNETLSYLVSSIIVLVLSVVFSYIAKLLIIKIKNKII